jgi:hypothetical protein
VSDIGGFSLGRLPDDIGPSVSEFSYEWEGVSFRSRVWETEHDEGFRVDLKITVLRGEELADADALRTFLARHHEWDLDTWTPVQADLGGLRGYAGEKVVFFLHEPGVGIEVFSPSARHHPAELRAIATAIRPNRD